MPPTYSPSKALLYPVILYFLLHHLFRNPFGDWLKMDGIGLLIYLQTQDLPEK
jgi:hypothetical protein